MTDRRSDVRVPDRMLPHSIEAERALLGAIMVSPTLIALLPPGLSESSFYRDAHRRVFHALSALHERQMVIDYLTLKEELSRTGELDECGGPAYLASLVDGMPLASNASGYAGTVIEYATRRAVIYLSNRILSEAYDGDLRGMELLDFATREILTASASEARGGLVPVRALISETLEALERAHGGHALLTGIGTGFVDLDTYTGGFQRSDLILVAARPGMGKTSLAMNVAERAAVRDGKIVAVFSLEMSRNQLMTRLVSSMARVEAHRLRAGHLLDRDYARISHALGAVAEASLAIDDTAGLPIGDLAARARRSKIERGGLDLIVVDYLQLVRTRERHQSREQEVSAVSRGLKALAKELDVPVIACCQLNRAPEGRKGGRPQLSDLRESGSLEQDADVVLFLHQEGGEEHEGVVTLVIGKQRNGPSGQDVRLSWQPAYTRFEDLAGPGMV